MRRLSLIALIIITACGEEKPTSSIDLSIVENKPPASPSDPLPINGTTNQEVDEGGNWLSWQCSDPENDLLTYDVYFGTSIDAPLVDSNITQNFYSTERLQHSTTYYWKIVAKDSVGGQANGPIWNFITTDEQTNITLVGEYNTLDQALGVFIEGTNAYVVGYTGNFKIINIQDQANPSLSGEIALPYFATDVFVYGNYAYVPVRDSGLSIINIQNPLDPILIGQYRFPNISSAYGVAVRDSFAYLACGLPRRVFQVLNVSNPANPTLVTEFTLTFNLWNVCLDGNYAYVSGDFGLYIIDISDPPNAWQVTSISTGHYARDIFILNGLAYVAYSDSGLTIVDVLNPSIPRIVGRYRISGHFTESVYVSGNYAYLAGKFGLEILDVTNPVVPERIDGFETTFANGIYELNDYIYLANNSPGLQIFRFVP